MSIKKVRAVNFKSFKEVDVELGKLNVLIGANASGKSNFVEIFKFLRDISNYGLNNAISMHGGAEYLRNINVGASNELSLKIVSDMEFRHAVQKNGDLFGIKTYETIYEFTLEFRRRGSGFKIAKDNLTLKCKLVRLEKQKKKTKEKNEIGQGEIIVSNIDGKVETKFQPEGMHQPEGMKIVIDDIFPPFLKELAPTKKLLLETPFFMIPFMPSLVEIFESISIYNIDPKLSKKATPITGKANLEEDGGNLSIILKNIIEDREGKRKLFNFVQDLLPFISEIDVEKLADRCLLFKLKEKYSKKQYLPASMISDGTINITALIVSLYFEEERIVIFEEPERNIHPYLISKITEMMKDASQRKQIIVTTHNPEMVKYAGLENILLISRDEEGFSTISKPADKEEVKIFLKNKIGIDELHVQNLLEV